MAPSRVLINGMDSEVFSEGAVKDAFGVTPEADIVID
jgi:hypothetical protein